MFFKRHQHSYLDEELITGSELSRIIGISGARISKLKDKGKLDTFENSRHMACFHRIVSQQQYSLFKDRSHVTTSTQAQRAAGYDNVDAQAVAHVFGSENPKMSAPVPNHASVQSFDFGGAMQERQELEVSRAEKEYHLARLSKLKADALEESLVDKQMVYTKCYQLGAMVQEKVMNMYIQLGPKICGRVQELLNDAGIEMEKIRIAMKDANHELGEIIRKESIETLKFLSEKTKENVLD